MDINEEDLKRLGVTLDKQNKVIDFGGKKVEYTSDEVPTKFVIRSKHRRHINDSFYFVTGLDIINGGSMLWLGPIELLNRIGTYPSTIHEKMGKITYILDNLSIECKGFEWIIQEEDPESEWPDDELI